MLKWFGAIIATLATGQVKISKKKKTNISPFSATYIKLTFLFLSFPMPMPEMVKCSFFNNSFNPFGQKPDRRFPFFSPSLTILLEKVLPHPARPAQHFQLKSLLKILSVSQGFNKTSGFTGNFSKVFRVMRDMVGGGCYGESHSFKVKIETRWEHSTFL